MNTQQIIGQNRCGGRGEQVWSRYKHKNQQPRKYIDRTRCERLRMCSGGEESKKDE